MDKDFYLQDVRNPDLNCECSATCKLLSRLGYAWSRFIHDDCKGQHFGILLNDGTHVVIETILRAYKDTHGVIWIDVLIKEDFKDSSISKLPVEISCMINTAAINTNRITMVYEGNDL